MTRQLTYNGWQGRRLVTIPNEQPPYIDGRSWLVVERRLEGRTYRDIGQEIERSPERVRKLLNDAVGAIDRGYAFPRRINRARG